MDNVLVTIVSYKNEKAADFIKEKLEFDNIQCFLSVEPIDYSSENISKEVIILKVRANDTEKAFTSLLKVYKTYDITNLKKDDKLKDLKKILVPIDLSDIAINISKYAISMAKMINAEIEFLYVYEDQSNNRYMKRTSIQKHAHRADHQALIAAEEKLLNFSNKLKEEISENDFEGVKLHYVIRKGDPTDIINLISKKYKPNFMILGPREKKDKANIFIGSVTTSVIENAKIPVLTIPKQAKFTGQAIKVMYNTNVNDSDHSSLHRLLEIVSPFDAEIYCVHIDTGNDNLKKGKMEDLKKHVTEKYPTTKFDFDLLENTKFYTAFENYIKEHNINIVSFSSPKRNLIYKIFNTNKLKKLVEASKIPMLIFRTYN